MPPTTATELPPFSPPQPPADSAHGEAVAVSYNYSTRQWTLTYQSGATVSGPPGTRLGKPILNHEDAIAKLPSPTPTTTLPPVSAYTPFTVPAGLPSLPSIVDLDLATAPFRHKSATANYNRSSSAPTAVTYEKLEFLGDAQIEHLASRLLYTRFPHLLAGQQSQLRELLVKNETLAEYARAYGFEGKVQVAELATSMNGGGGHEKKGNKGFNKVLGDVFEAYVAAVILSHGDEGFAIAEKWMTSLWAPKLVEATSGRDSNIYDPTAKATLQKLLLGSKDTRLDYTPYKKSVELKGDRLGQNRHFIAVYLTGYGYDRRLLGKGEGRNKVEAGNWAAVDAMFGEGTDVVEECAGRLRVAREARQREKEKEGEEQGEAAKATVAATPTHASGND
ncbi:hypothetical protein BAUCODRAFT_69163 [Baudoinia panamericana UAMH 10762]|uniref:RNase III domain-containing protein n=1 Tax=Baudoinia panamericana (strain UAMH 10762) TaxID=717646 RepID=M2MKF0_BAUPA|nr:uncharacterized protein BAUCODRAFT_69163 [Baudoinia panamericana UAMH 10762]EMC97171.1 hypothetical protein BAUCODRAFT_69163 [Baudoinia panamericana UAMH 10762]